MQNTKAGENPILPLLNASDCMQEAYTKALLELMQRAKRYKDQRSFRSNFLKIKLINMKIYLLKV